MSKILSEKNKKVKALINIIIKIIIEAIIKTIIPIALFFALACFFNSREIKLFGSENAGDWIVGLLAISFQVTFLTTTLLGGLSDKSEKIYWEDYPTEHLIQHPISYRYLSCISYICIFLETGISILSIINNDIKSLHFFKTLSISAIFISAFIIGNLAIIFLGYKFTAIYFNKKYLRWKAKFKYIRMAKKHIRSSDTIDEIDWKLVRLYNNTTYAIEKKNIESIENNILLLCDRSFKNDKMNSEKYESLNSKLDTYLDMITKAIEKRDPMIMGQVCIYMDAQNKFEKIQDDQKLKFIELLFKSMTYKTFDFGKSEMGRWFFDHLSYVNKNNMDLYGTFFDMFMNGEAQEDYIRLMWGLRDLIPPCSDTIEESENVKHFNKIYEKYTYELFEQFLQSIENKENCERFYKYVMDYIYEYPLPKNETIIDLEYEDMINNYPLEFYNIHYTNMKTIVEWANGGNVKYFISSIENIRDPNTKERTYQFLGDVFESCSDGLLKSAGDDILNKGILVTLGGIIKENDSDHISEFVKEYLSLFKKKETPEYVSPFIWELFRNNIEIPKDCNSFPLLASLNIMLSNTWDAMIPSCIEYMDKYEIYCENENIIHDRAQELAELLLKWISDLINGTGDLFYKDNKDIVESFDPELFKKEKLDQAISNPDERKKSAIALLKLTEKLIWHGQTKLYDEYKDNMQKLPDKLSEIYNDDKDNMQNEILDHYQTLCNENEDSEIEELKKQPLWIEEDLDAIEKDMQKWSEDLSNSVDLQDHIEEMKEYYDTKVFGKDVYGSWSVLANKSLEEKNQDTGN